MSRVFVRGIKFSLLVLLCAGFLIAVRAQTVEHGKPRVFGGGNDISSPSKTRSDKTARANAPEASINVTTTADTIDAGSCATLTIASLPGPDGKVGLREAICAANNTAGADTINLPPGTYTLTRTGINEDRNDTGDLDILDSLTINGSPGSAAITIIDGNNTDRVIDNFPASPITINLSNLTVRNGKLQPTENVNIGAGIFVDFNTTMTLTNVQVVGNDATPVTGNAGGIGSNGALTITNSVIANNKASVQGGGIRSSNTLSITNTTIDGNTTGGDGAGLWAGTSSSRTVTISGSTISNNTTTGGNGGGIRIDTDGTVNITNSTISGNRAATDGGGLYGRTTPSTGTGVINLNSVTITNNYADNDNNGSGAGGGIFREAGLLVLRLRNTIVAKNYNSTTATPDDVAGTLTSQGYNFIGVGTGFTPTTGDQVGSFATPFDPKLDPLANNGGTTLTHRLQSNSSAIDKADNATCPATDQRGVSRPIDGDAAPGAVCDIGSYEAALRPTAAAVTVSGKVIADRLDAKSATVYLTDAEGGVRTARVNPFGYYRFADVPAGQTYILSVSSKGAIFIPQVVYVTGDITELNLAAIP